MGLSMKTEQITYDKFSQMVQKMVENGEKLTVRSVHGRLGGNFGKISEFLKRWEEERAYLSLVKQGDISDSLRLSVSEVICTDVISPLHYRKIAAKLLMFIPGLLRRRC